MSNLTRQQKSEIDSIVLDAEMVCPSKWRDELSKYFQHLAYLAVTEQNTWHLQDIQLMIDVAKADNALALVAMTEKLNTEISQLRAETEQGFMALGQAMQSVSDRVEHLETKQQPPTVNVHVTNSGNEETPEWIWKVLVMIAITGLLLVAQSLQVQNAFQLELQQRQEVR